LDLAVDESVLNARRFSLREIVELVATYEPAPADLAAAALRRICCAFALRHRPRSVGISLTFYSQLIPGLLVARWLRELLPDASIVLGGQQMMLHGAELVTEAALAEFVDFVCVGDGEEALWDVCRYRDGLIGKDDLAETLFVRGTAEERRMSPGPRRTAVRFRDLPTPDFSDLPISEYIADDVQLALTTCVGCAWGRCTFCSYGNRSYTDNTYQQASPEQIARDCAALVERYRTHRINFVDENTNLRLVLSAMALLRRRGTEVLFSCRSRLEPCLADREFAHALARAGCVSIACGYEGVAPRLLESLNRGVAPELYQRIVDTLHEAGIVLRLSVMGGVPGESAEDVRSSEDFLLRNRDKLGIDTLQMLVLEKGTLLHESPRGIVPLAGDRLQGNALLNYGMGRMGIAYRYAEGPEFQQREQRLAEFHARFGRRTDGVTRGPRRAHNLRDACEEACSEPHSAWALKLYPWVRSIAGARSLWLMDLLWDRVFELADARVDELGRLSPAGRAGELSWLRPLLAQELGEAERVRECG
jgi:radical SAM superfamily enzyme YgiQ (UPF0313 family)